MSLHSWILMGHLQGKQEGSGGLITNAHQPGELQGCHIPGVPLGERCCHSRKQDLFAGHLGWALPAVYSAMDLGIELNTFWAEISGIFFFLVASPNTKHHFVTTHACTGDLILLNIFWTSWHPNHCPHWALSPLQNSLRRPLSLVLTAALQIICTLFHLILLWDLKSQSCVPHSQPWCLVK